MAHQVFALVVFSAVDEEVFVAKRQHRQMCTEKELWLATARVDVPTAPFFCSADQGVQHMCASFCANAWLCACQATDRDLDSSNTIKRLNAWIRALLTTDRDLDSSCHSR